ncbi:hypothetical protein HA72_1996 [Metallosphaera sedula]|uniref:Carboxypeptidase regulatory-like domain-containing protein n=3 Tax=Metallosphaera TaxID=41980 RepID=A4YI84_METS5|nr:MULTISPECIES: hypothetical protein [Metallosphaera]ABP96136.1 hypothetical protein Msed_1996 [Metallosphaera sedula DSM 5348]AIM28119.1 hypothetical protein HA72_1996 [Metallosphaera sedula]AKV74944.1 hypothetical protein MsedA_2046 [Metallosphaera sedula]AKV77182.1 hypothetical protein MsedB_2048 [Metallosphaera sedula]AKV79432.1 hypothetical protein MsedC_2046 [Metallosphaera sedula]
MNKTVLLALAFVVLILTVAGVVAASSYKTRLTITPLGSSSNGEYTLQVKVIMNYGPFGGEQPLNDAVVQVTGQNGSFYRNFTLSNGIATFTLPEGVYTVNVASLHYTFKVDLTQNEMATLTYAYLVS